MNSPVVSKKLLCGVWLALLLLLLLTWGLAQLDLHHFNMPAAMGIALVKMLLVILVFMHVKYKPPLMWVFVAAGFIWLFIMIDLTLADYLSRGAVPTNPDASWQHGTWPPPVKNQSDSPPGPAVR
jgi:cytochrome c oxidase subunit 4